MAMCIRTLLLVATGPVLGVVEAFPSGWITSASWSPRVYVYDLPIELPSGEVLRDTDDHCEQVAAGSPAQHDCLFGKQFTLGAPAGSSAEKLQLRAVDQFYLARIIHARLLNSSRRVGSPEDADLFYVPIWYENPVGGWGYKDSGLRGFGKCPNEEQVLKLLPFLNRSTAQKHFFISPRTGEYSSGLQDVCPFWTARYDKAAPDSASSIFALTTKMALEDAKCCPNMPTPYFHTIPYPGLGSGLTGDAWEALRRAASPGIPRSLLVMGAMRFHGIDVNLREKWAKQCEESTLCTNVHLDFNHDVAGSWRRLTSTMLEAVFCLQPPGDTPSRKGMVDSILLGCIPVLSDPEQQSFWPWHLTSFKEFAVLRDPAVPNIVDQLHGIKEAEVARLRAGLVNASKHLAYTLEEGQADAVEVAILGAYFARHRHQLSRRHGLLGSGSCCRWPSQSLSVL